MAHLFKSLKCKHGFLLMVCGLAFFSIRAQEAAQITANIHYQLDGGILLLYGTSQNNGPKAQELRYEMVIGATDFSGNQSKNTQKGTIAQPPQQLTKLSSTTLKVGSGTIVTVQLQVYSMDLRLLAEASQKIKT